MTRPLKGRSARVVGWIGGVLLSAVTAGLLVPAGGAEERLSLGAISADPSAYHRRAVVLQGRAKQVVRYGGLDYVNQPMCSQDFLLEDDTGTLPIRYEVRCQSGQQQAVSVTEGDVLLIHGTVEAPPRHIKQADGSALDYKVMATKILPQGR